MFTDYINEIKKNLIDNRLWEDSFKIFPNSKNGGQSLCFFIIGKHDKIIYVAKFFDYLKDLGAITNIVKIGECNNIDEYLEMISEKQIPYDIDNISEIVYYLKRCFSRYIEVTKNTDNLFPKVLCYNENIKINNSFYGFLIEEAIDGITLQEKMRNVIMNGEDNVKLAVQCLSDIGEAVEKLYDNGYVHRDLSPDNIMINNKDNRMVVIDPGTIKIINRDTTNLGYIFAKRQYASPEQFQGRAVEADFSSDLYSLGIIVYEIITGRNLIVDYIKRNPNDPHTLICKELDRDIENKFFEYCNDGEERNIIIFSILKKMLQVNKDLRFADAKTFNNSIDIVKEARND